MTSGAASVGYGFRQMPAPGRKVEIVSYLLPSSNPRVPKEAEALSRAGFDVTMVTSALPGSAVLAATAQNGVQLRQLNQRAPWWGLWRHRMLQKSARLWPVALRPQVAAYGSSFLDLFRFLRAAPMNVARIIHLEPAFLAADAASVLDSAFCDFEDWYSEDLLPGRRSVALTNQLKEAEKRALKDSLACWCTSQSMAAALAGAYNAEEALIIRNVFPRRMREGIDGRWDDRPGMSQCSDSNDPAAPRPQGAPVSFHWFSQTIGPGRGLEDVFAALADVSGEWELHLRGGMGNYGRWLEEQCPSAVRRRLRIHALVSSEELTSRIAEHDVGLACESAVPRSRDVTITNKFFQYLQAGLAVVASDTAGQREAAGLAGGAVELYGSGDSDSLRSLLQKLVLDREKLGTMRRSAWQAGARLVWENEAPKLVEAVERVSGMRQKA